MGEISQIFIKTVLIAAKKNLTRNWVKVTAPTKAQWTTTIEDILLLTKKLR